MSASASCHSDLRRKFYCNCCLIALKLFELPSSNGQRRMPNKQYLTSCYHILCNDCRLTNDHNCAACKRKCTFMEISNKMPNHFQWYFQPLSETEKHLIKVTKFHRMQYELTSELLYTKLRTIAKKRRETSKLAAIAGWKQRQAKSQLRKIQIIHRKCIEEER